MTISWQRVVLFFVVKLSKFVVAVGIADAPLEEIQRFFRSTSHYSLHLLRKRWAFYLISICVTGTVCGAGSSQHECWNADSGLKEERIFICRKFSAGIFWLS